MDRGPLCRCRARTDLERPFASGSAAAKRFRFWRRTQQRLGPNPSRRVSERVLGPRFCLPKLGRLLRNAPPAESEDGSGPLLAALALFARQLRQGRLDWRKLFAHLTGGRVESPAGQGAIEENGPHGKRRLRVAAQRRTGGVARRCRARWLRAPCLSLWFGASLAVAGCRNTTETGRGTSLPVEDRDSNSAAICRMSRLRYHRRTGAAGS